MEKNHLIIIGLIVVVIALVAGLAYTMAGNNLSGGGNAPDGMQKYDFNSEFKMNVPNNARFLKEWNYTDPTFGTGYSYLDKENEFAVSFMNTPLITHEYISNMVDTINKSGNATVEYEGDLIIGHNLKANGKVGNSLENTNFTEIVMIQKGHTMVTVSGNDLDFIKSIINSIEFYE
ncbi:MAG: hypothetical protein ACSW71_02130 [Methanobrevibacter sp.]